MKENSQPTDILRLNGNLNAPYTPSGDCANCDPRFDADDDTREIIAGLRDLARMEGEAAHG